MSREIPTRAFNKKKIDEFIARLPEILKENGEYFRSYCEGAIKAMWKLGIMTKRRQEKIEEEMRKITESKDEWN